MKTIEPTVESLTELRVEAEAWKVAYKALCAELVMHEMPASKLMGYAERVQRSVVAYLQHGRLFTSPGATSIAEDCTKLVEHSVSWWHRSAEHEEKKRQVAEARDAQALADAAPDAGPANPTVDPAP